MSFPTAALPEKGPGPPVELLLPSPALGPGPNENNGVAGFEFPNQGVLGFVLLVSLKKDFAAAAVEGSFIADVRDVEVKSPLYPGFVSAFTPLEGIDDGFPKEFPLDESIADRNNLPASSVLESVRLVAPPVNTVGFGLVLSGFGEGILSFGSTEGEGVPL